MEKDPTKYFESHFDVCDTTFIILLQTPYQNRVVACEQNKLA